MLALLAQLASVEGELDANAARGPSDRYITAG
jgi:hypothetical protein